MNHEVESPKNYFGKREEEAVRRYQVSVSEKERNHIFKTIIYPAFSKLVECILNKWKLYTSDQLYEDLKRDAISDLAEKIDKFKPSKDKKAYSYFGTICKHFLIAERAKAAKRMGKIIPYDEYVRDMGLEDCNETENCYDSLNENAQCYDELDYNASYPSYWDSNDGYDDDDCASVDFIDDNDFTEVDNSDNFAVEMISEMCKHIGKMIDNSDGYELTENEIKIGNAIIYLFNNWEEILVENGGKKFTKSSILYYLREVTLLSTIEVHSSLKKFKEAYNTLKKEVSDR